VSGEALGARDKAGTGRGRVLGAGCWRGNCLGEPLLHRVAAGDRSAIDELLARYGGLVYALARRLCPEHAEIEDAVQEVFMALWQSAGRFDAALGSEETFVAMVTRRRLIDRRRRWSRRAMPTVDADLGALLADAGGGGPGRLGVTDAHAPDPAAHGERSEDLQRALRLLRTLRPEQQQAITLSVVHGLSHEQIAALTGMPLGTVKTHVRRGFIALREAMQGRASKSGGAGESARGAPVEGRVGPPSR
jgi:RNA polymerase sigma factor (sigma-70 family)